MAIPHMLVDYVLTCSIEATKREGKSEDLVQAVCPILHSRPMTQAAFHRTLQTVYCHSQEFCDDLDMMARIDMALLGMRIQEAVRTNIFL